MNHRKLHLPLLIFFCVVSLSSHISAQSPSPEPLPESSQTSEINLIHQGDLIDVDIIGSTDFDWRGKINPEGFLDGTNFTDNPVYGLCQSEETVAKAVSAAYSKILREPKVVVRILDRSDRPFSLLYGAVKNPQRFQIKRPVLLNELLILAGGLVDKASGDIQIFRPPGLSCQPTEKNPTSTAATGENRDRFVFASQDNGANYINVRIVDLLQGKPEANPQILSGDIVTVQEAEVIYIIGGVVNPKQISSRTQLTLSRAIDSAGGIVKGGDAKNIKIFRRDAGETKIIEADLDKIKSNQTDDIALKPFDIIEVAQRGSGKNKFPPVLKVSETVRTSASNFPLRIID